MYDQWEAQLLAIIQLKARVGLYGELHPGDLRKAHIEPLADIGEAVGRELERIGTDAPVAVLARGTADDSVRGVLSSRAHLRWRGTE